MPVLPDPRQRWIAALAAVAVAAVIACGSLAAWAFGDRQPIVLRTPQPTADAPDAATPTVLDPGVWQVSLWRPFTDQPAAQAAAAPISVKLFSVLRRGPVLTAALETGNGLVYAKAGETVGGITVVALDPSGADVLVNGTRTRLAVSR